MAPEKGVFPLDHFAECKKAMQSYLACLKVGAAPLLSHFTSPISRH